MSSAPGQGTCHVFFAFEVGFAIDLAAAERLLAAGDREGLAIGGRNPSGSDFHPRPVRVAEPIQPALVAAWQTTDSCVATLYDFGAMSIEIEIPLVGIGQDSLESLLPLGRALSNNRALLELARHAANRVLARVASTVSKPALAPQSEDYIVYALPVHGAAAGTNLDKPLVARILRAEEGALSDEETKDAFAHAVRYSPNDLAVVDWNAALLLDNDPSSAIAVLEFANTELLEMRHLDDELDASLSEAYGLSSRHLRRRRLFSKRLARDASRLAELQIDAASLFEAVNNALKLFGDQYLARLHFAAVQRFHTEDYERSVLRKLETLESIYGKIRDSQAQLRAEILEWIIIVLIALEIALSLMRWTL